MDLSFLPLVNASLNGVATVFLSAGVWFVKRKQIAAHRACMLSAFATSTLFLVLYVTHKIWKSTQTGDLHTRFEGPAAARGLYIVLLLTHVVLAIAVPPLAIWMIRLGWARRDEAHRRLARWAFPIWIYVSITGVVIYVMLYHLNAAVRG